MVRDIVLYGNPILKRKASWVKKIDHDIKRLIRDLKDTIKVENGVGLSSNQIGMLKRVIVLHEVGEEDGSEKIFALINPEIIEKEGQIEDSEGCLSFPGLYISIVRAEKVKVIYIDENGDTVEREFSGILARAIQHELDHLDGILFIDRMDKNDEESQKLLKEWKREFMLGKVIKNKVGNL